MNTGGRIAKPVLVTGATGFIGSRVVHKLLQDEIAVKALLLPDEMVPSGWADRVEIVRGSIADSRTVEDAAKGVQTMIHLDRVGSQHTDWPGSP